MNETLGINDGRFAIDPEAVISEIIDRYSGMEKPQSMGILLCENPDLKDQIKELQVVSKDVFGQPLPKVLQDRGIIGRASRNVESERDETSDDAIRKMLDRLAAKYANAPIKPANLAELKADNLSDKRLITVFNDRCRLMFGVTAKTKLVELGIFERPKSFVVDASEEEIFRALDDIAGFVMELEDSEKPSTLSDLQKAYPEQGEYIKAGKKKGLIDKGPLQQLGLLAPTRALLKREGIRRASADSLASDYAALGRQMLISPGDDAAALFPPYVVGIDVDAKVELREFIATVTGSAAKSLVAGAKLAINITQATRDWGEPYLVVRIQTSPASALALGNISDGALENSDSPLGDFVGGEVLTVSCGEGADVAQIRTRFLADLKASTLAYVLRAVGIVTDKDVRGSMEWRYRVRNASLGKDPFTKQTIEESSAQLEEKAEGKDIVPVSDIVKQEAPSGSEAGGNTGFATGFRVSVKSEGKASASAISSDAAKETEEKEKERREAEEKAERERLEAEQEKERERRKAEEKARREAEEKAEQERKKAEERDRQKAEEKALAQKRFVELDEQLKKAEQRKGSLEKHVETPSEKEVKRITAEIDLLRKELSGLGLFARSRKKDIEASIMRQESSLYAAEARALVEKDAADKKRKAELSETDMTIKKLKDEIAPFRAIVMEDVAKSLTGKKDGDVVSFGSYVQESATAQPTPIEWTILEKRGNELLLLSTEVLDCQKFNDKKSESRSYATSDLCEWLKRGFAEKAFSSVEKLFIQDGPFILNAGEVRKYMGSDNRRTCKPTKYAISRGAEAASYYLVSGNTFYWVATEDFDGFYYVNPYGVLMGGGGTAFVNGTCIGNNGMDETFKCGVRPAVRVRIE